MIPLAYVQAEGMVLLTSALMLVVGLAAAYAVVRLAVRAELRRQGSEEAR